ncbi:unnamed protein product, partial [Brenthis ino]
MFIGHSVVYDGKEAEFVYENVRLGYEGLQTEDSEMVEVNVRAKCATRRRNTSEWIPLVERGQAGSGTGVRACNIAT